MAHAMQTFSRMANKTVVVTGAAHGCVQYFCDFWLDPLCVDPLLVKITYYLLPPANDMPCLRYAFRCAVCCGVLCAVPCAVPCAVLCGVVCAVLCCFAVCRVPCAVMLYYVLCTGGATLWHVCVRARVCACVCVGGCSIAKATATLMAREGGRVILADRDAVVRTMRDAIPA